MKEKIYNIVIKILVTLFGRRFVYAIRYYRLRKRWPNFDQPQDLSEYLINKITTNQTHSYAPLADKIEVRQYVASKGLSSILLPHYGYWSNAHDIDFDTLPPKFVLKTNNGVDSQNVYICRDKSTFDIPSVCKKLNKALKEKSVYEYHYNLIQPQILCEQLLETQQGTQPTDYKFLCINGKVVDIIATMDRFEHKRSIIMTPDWQYVDRMYHQYIPDTLPPRPNQLQQMINIAQTLSADFDVVRVDLYNPGDKIYFGELTFTPSAGLLDARTTQAITHYATLLRG